MCSIIRWLFAERSSKGAVSTVCNTHLFVMRAWDVDRGKHFTHYIARIPTETPTTNVYVVNYLHIPAKTPTQVTAQEDWLYTHFHGVNITAIISCRWRNPADSNIYTRTSYYATLLYTWYRIWRSYIFLRKTILTFLLRHPVPAETKYAFPAAPVPRMTHSQKPTGTTQFQKITILLVIITVSLKNQLNNSH